MKTSSQKVAINYTQREDREANDKQLFAENRGKSRVGGQKVAIG